jgi:hypothetical protein
MRGQAQENKSSAKAVEPLGRAQWRIDSYLESRAKSLSPQNENPTQALKSACSVNSARSENLVLPLHQAGIATWSPIRLPEFVT